ncbi:MAG: hypothetical protein WBB76_10100 [Gaiellaceae bacterium]
MTARANVPASAPVHEVAAAATGTRSALIPAASESPHVSFPHGIFTSSALVPTVRKAPFLVLALVGLAILLLSLGVLPPSLAPTPAAAELLVESRVALAFGGIGTLVVAMAAYLLT